MRVPSTEKSTPTICTAKFIWQFWLQLCRCIILAEFLLSLNLLNKEEKMAITYDSTITCPVCGFSERLEMPVDY